MSNFTKWRVGLLKPLRSAAQLSSAQLAGPFDIPVHLQVNIVTITST